MRDPPHMFEDLTVELQKAIVGEIMVLQPRKGPRIGRWPAMRHPIGMHRGQRVLPSGPCAAIVLLDPQIAREQPPVISRDQIVPLIFGDQVHETRPQFGPEPPGPTAVKPIKLGLRHQKDAAQDQMAHRFGVRLGIDQRKRRAPRAAKNHPFVDAKRGANQLDIGDQMPCRVVRDRRMRGGAPASALIEQHHTVDLGVEIPPHRRAATTAGAAMQHDNGDAIGVATLLDIDLMPLPYGQHPLVERLNRRIKMRRAAFLVGILVHCRPI